MNKTIKFTLTSVWIILSRAYDAFATYQYTPDLSRESNPLVSVLGFEWTALMIVFVSLIILSIYAYYRSTFYDYDLMPKEKGYSFSHFIGYIYTGKKQNWTVLFYKIPGSLKRFTHYIGILLTQCLVFAGIVSTIMWLLINYTDFYLEIHSAKAIYSILLIGSVLISYLWFKKEYIKYNEIKISE